MKSQYVEYLIERLENAELDNRVMRLVLEDLSRELPHSNQMLEKSNELQSLLEEERNLCKSLTVRYKAEGTIRIHLQILFRFEEIVRKKDGSGSDAQDIFESVTVKYRLGCMSIVKNQLNLIVFF